MSLILLETKINANREIVFDLSRSIDLHKISTSHTKEEAISGVTEGLIGLNQSVTWKARHFGITQKLTSKITEYKRPNYFVDEMVKGAFKSFRHEHHFEESNGVAIMKDVFEFKAPFGILGKMAEAIFLKRYMTKLLSKRNQTIKVFAESGRWKEVIK